jgi:hypothetical protein
MRISIEEEPVMAEVTARMEGGWPVRAAAVAAGVFLVWRGIFARRGGGFAPLLAGIFILRRALGAGAGAWRAGGARDRPRRTPEVVEVKSPAELESGIVSASPRPTFPDRVDRPHDPSHGE